MQLGIDLGTSAVKVVACRNRRVVAADSVAMATKSPHPGWSEQDPGLWLKAMHAAVRRLMSAPEMEGQRVSAIGLSGQMHGAVLLDRDRNVLRPCILWNDSRSHGECGELSERIPRIGHLAGVPPLPGFTAPKLMWVARNEPEVHARIAHVLLPKDFIGFHLHGNLATDASDAAGTLWLDQEARRWSRELCDASDTCIDWLPKVLNGGEVAGHLQPGAAKALGLEPDIPIAAGGGDAATGAVAVGATETGRGFVSLGTSGQLFVATGAYSPNPERFVHAFAHTVPARWYQMAAMLNGARPLSWLASILNCSIADVLENAADAEPGRMPLFLPYLTGERSPHGDPHIRGAFYGLEDSTDTAGLCGSVVEAIAFSFADAAESFGTQFDDVPHLLAIGGGSRSDLLLQSISDATGKRILRAGDAEGGPALGAAILAETAAGVAESADSAEPPEANAEFNPKADATMLERLARFRSLYSALKAMR